MASGEMLDHLAVFGTPASVRPGGAIELTDEQAADLLLFSKQARDASRYCAYLMSAYNVMTVARHPLPQGLEQYADVPRSFAIPLESLRPLFKPATWVGLRGFRQLLTQSMEEFAEIRAADQERGGTLSRDVASARETTLAASCFAKITVKDLAAIHRRFFRDIDVAEFNYYANLLDDAIDGKAPLVEGDRLLPVKTDFQIRDPRVRINAQARIQGTSKAYLVCIRNVSPGGLGFDGGEDLLPGQQVELLLVQSGRRLLGRIAWKVGAKAGIEFAQRLEPNDPLMIAL